jgi:hypothetical protein
MPAVGVDDPAQCVRRCGDVFPVRRPAHGHLRHVQIGQHRGADDGLAGQLSALRMHCHPAGQVRDVRVDRAGRADIGVVAQRDGPEFTLVLVIRRGMVVGMLRVSAGKVARDHAQGLKDPRADGILPRAAVDRLDKITCDHEHDVIILVFAAQGLVSIEIGQPRDEVLAGDLAVIPHHVVAGQAGAMCHHVAWGDRLSRDRVAHPEAGQIGSYRLVPLQLAFLDQRPHHERGKRLRARRDGEERPGRDRQILLDVAMSKSLGVDHLALLDDGDRQAGDLEVLDRLLDDRVEAVERLSHDGDRIGRAAARELRRLAGRRTGGSGLSPHCGCDQRDEDEEARQCMATAAWRGQRRRHAEVLPWWVHRPRSPDARTNLTTMRWPRNDNCQRTGGRHGA